MNGFRHIRHGRSRRSPGMSAIGLLWCLRYLLSLPFIVSRPRPGGTSLQRRHTVPYARQRRFRGMCASRCHGEARASSSEAGGARRRAAPSAWRGAPGGRQLLRPLLDIVRFGADFKGRLCPPPVPGRKPAPAGAAEPDLSVRRARQNGESCGNAPLRRTATDGTGAICRRYRRGPGALPVAGNPRACRKGAAWGARPPPPEPARVQLLRVWDPT